MERGGPGRTEMNISLSHSREGLSTARGGQIWGVVSRGGCCVWPPCACRAGGRDVLPTQPRGVVLEGAGREQEPADPRLASAARQGHCWV